MKRLFYLLFLFFIVNADIFAQKNEVIDIKKKAEFATYYKSSQYLKFNEIDSLLSIEHISYDGHYESEGTGGPQKHEQSLLKSFIKKRGYNRAARLDSVDLDITDAQKQIDYLYSYLSEDSFFIFRTMGDQLTIVACGFK